jgi:tRNA dimethylallyltransferase
VAMQASESIKKPPAICLMGPTAAGKTQFAMDLSDRFPSTLINVDSAQVYRGMDIGTGKPDATTRRQYPHRLMDIRDPSETYSASQFRADAIREMSDVLVRGKTPVLVGGTMLYFKVLRDGLAAMPNASPKVRKQIEALAAERGWETVHAELKKVDPESAARIHANDPQRLQRALEVFLLTGKSLTALHQENHDPAELPCHLCFVAIQPTDRAVLHNRIAERFRRMLSEGLIEEVRVLYERGDLNLSMSSMKSVGYRQVWQYLAGEFTHGEMIEKSIVATRQLAKRQLTWLRGWPALSPLGEPDKNSIDVVLKILETAAP